MLDVMYLQKKQAIETLINLRNAGITEGEIAELARFVGVRGKQWQYGIGVGNGSGGNTNTNFSSGGKTNQFKFKLDDRLNCNLTNT